MVKSDVCRYSPSDFQLIEEAIVNLEVMIPCSQRRSKSTEAGKSYKRQKLIT